MSHEPYVASEPPLTRDMSVLRDWLSFEMRRIQNAFNGVDLDAESRWKTRYLPLQATDLPTSTLTLTTAMMLPNDVKAGTVMKLEALWRMEAAGHADKTMVLQGQAWLGKPGEAPASAGTYTVTATAGAVSVDIRTSLMDITASGSASDRIFHAQLERGYGWAGDILTATAHLHGIILKYEADSHGGTQSSVK